MRPMDLLVAILIRCVFFLSLVGCSSIETKRECRVTCEDCNAKQIELYCSGSLSESELRGVK